MSWDHFATIRRLDPPLPSPGARRAEAAHDPMEGILILPHGFETESGAGDPPPADAGLYAARSAVSPVPRGSNKPASLGCKHFEDGKTPEEVIRKVIEIAKRHPGEAAFLEAQATINELSRSPEGAALVRKHVTPELVREIAAKGCGGGKNDGH